MLVHLGSWQDKRQWSTLARVNDNSRQAKVDGARRLIHEKHYALDGNAINGLLQAQSLVLTKVNLLDGIYLNICLTSDLECIFISPACSGLQFFLTASC